jgi:type II secretory pathway component PulC
MATLVCLAPAVAAADASRLPPIDAFGDVLERPLFAPDRRRHAADPPNATVAPPFSLRGIIIEGGTRIALIAEGDKTRRVVEGQPLRGGRLIGILPDRIVLTTADGVRSEIPLRGQPPQASPPPAGDTPSRSHRPPSPSQPGQANVSQR